MSYELERRLKFIDSPIASNSSRDYNLKAARLLKKRVKVMRDLCHSGRSICVVGSNRYGYYSYGKSIVDILIYLPSLKLYNMYQKMGIKLFDWLIKYLEFTIRNK